jgi:hypothetical protein
MGKMSYETVLGIICSLWLGSLLTKIVIDLKEIRKIDRLLYGDEKRIWRK